MEIAETLLYGRLWGAFFVSAGLFIRKAGPFIRKNTRFCMLSRDCSFVDNLLDPQTYSQLSGTVHS